MINSVSFMRLADHYIVACRPRVFGRTFKVRLRTRSRNSAKLAAALIALMGGLGREASLALANA